MSTSINDGGPAFPLQSIGPDFPVGYCGMTLRDYFAGQALAGMLASAKDCDGFTEARVAITQPAQCASAAVAFADALITELKRKATT